MNKKIFTLFVLLLLLPVTALAADGIELYVGGQLITESGCYEKNQDGNWTKVGSAEPASGQFYYDAATFTLTLNQAEITHDQTVNVAEGYTYDGSVIAFSQTADVSLNIVVSQGTSTITGKGGIRVESTTGNASLSIKGSGSLDVEPKGSNSGITLCSSKNTNLDIDGADVTASSPSLYGVYLLSDTATSTSTITVNNGSLTTGGNGNVGIYYYWPGTNNAGTSSLTVSGNAVVDTRNSQIMAQNKETVVQVGAGSDGNGGIVFNGKNGTVYGDVTLQEDLKIGEGESLTIPGGSSLNANGKLTNDGTIIVKGELTGDVEGNGSIPITNITLDKTVLSLDVDKTATLRAMITPEQATEKAVTWISNNTNIATVDENGTVTAVSVGTVIITVTTADDSKTATCEVTVAHSDLKHFDRKEATCTEWGNIEYWHCEGCGKYFSDAEGKSEINLAQTVINATGHNLTKTEAKEPTCTEAGNKEYWTCESCGSLFRDEVGSAEIKLEDVVIPATGHHYVNGYCTECGHRDPDYRPDPISYYNIYVEDVCDGVEVSASKQVVREGGSISLYVEKDTANYTFDNFKVYYKRSYYGTWDELKEGTQPGEYPINNIWTHIYIKAQGAEEKEDPTGIESIEGVKVYTKDGSLYVQTPQREQVLVISMSGAVVKNEEQIGLKQYHGLQPGIYIVRVGDKAYKVRLN